MGKGNPCRSWRADYGAGVGLAALWGVHTFLSMAKEKCAKESQWHGDSRGGPRRYAPWASVCGSPFGAVLVLGSLRSPAGKKASIAHFGGGARNVAHNLVGELTHAIVRARAHSFPLSKRAGLFPSAAYRRSAPPQLAVGRLIPCGVNGFLMVGWLCRDKGQQVFEKMLAFVASHEARRRMAV